MAPLIEARALARRYVTPAPWWHALTGRRTAQVVHAVDGVDLMIHRGRTLGLVGESGCGKTTVGRMMVGLERPSAGQVHMADEPLGTSHRGRIQMVFQDPLASLNPRWTVEQIVAEPLRALGRARSLKAAGDDVVRLLEGVGLSAQDRGRHPHQFSGGQRQRISIARALATSPEFIVCDEPTSALDVSVQAQVLNLMADLQQSRGLAYLFISHNLGVVRHVSDDVAVMYLGRVVEQSATGALFAHPRHPYTRQLLDAIPDPAARRRRRVIPIGEVPDPMAPPTGCHFHPRCPHVQPRCRAERPALLPVDGGGAVACHAVAEGRL